MDFCLCSSVPVLLMLVCVFIPFQLERRKTQADISLRNLQQTHDDLKRRLEVISPHEKVVTILYMYICRYDETVEELKKVHQQSSDSQRKADTGENRVKWVIGYFRLGRKLIFLTCFMVKPVSLVTVKPVSLTRSER